MAVDKDDYGRVKILTGKHRYRFGIYDDIGLDDDGNEVAIVYIGLVPYRGEYTKCKFDEIERIKPRGV